MTNNEIDILKKKLQALFTDDLVTIVGSGLSCAEGLPGMDALADELCAKIPTRITSGDLPLWNAIKEHLVAGDGLELALHKATANEAVEDAIISVTADFVLSKELATIEECLNAGRKLKLSSLLPHLSATNPKVARIITTNYDRLIEFTVERAGWGVDTMMIGRYWGSHNPDASDKSFVQGVLYNSKSPRLHYRNRVRLFKPHGSLDWYSSGGGVVASVMPLTGQRLIITPGVGKYRKGYQQPFDAHREQGNAAIDNASAVLCIGYGFNDEHLQTHLLARLAAGTRGLLLTWQLSDKALEALKQSPNLVALSCHSDKTAPGTVVTTATGSHLIPDVNWWDVEEFVKGVLSA